MAPGTGNRRSGSISLTGGDFGVLALYFLLAILFGDFEPVNIYFGTPLQRQPSTGSGWPSLAALYLIGEVMINLRVDPEYRGPSIIEAECLLSLGHDTIEVAWTNTKRELDVLRRFSDRPVILIVPDLRLMVRTASVLGIEFTLPSEILRAAMNSLNGVEGQWRTFTEQVGPEVALSAILQNAANGILKGVSHDPLRKVLIECLLGGISPVDLDLLLALRLNGADV
jgi:hypothetical protein